MRAIKCILLIFLWVGLVCGVLGVVFGLLGILDVFAYAEFYILWLLLCIIQWLCAVASVAVNWLTY